MFNFLKSAADVGKRFIGSIGETLRKVGDTTAKVVRGVGGFVRDYHDPIAKVAHGIAMASGNETAQKITGGLVGLSGMYGVRQKLDTLKKEQQEARARGGSGVWDIQAKRFN
jgi:hypothetical protein